MKHVPLTDKIGLKIVNKLQEAYKQNNRCVGTSVFQNTIYHEACYAPTATRLATSAFDHFGLLYQGWSGRALYQKLGEEAEVWLDYLLNPEGPFRAILPYLFHTTSKEIIEDKGFVFKDLALPKNSANLGLLWTFAQATRYFFENPGRMARFLYLHGFLKDKNMVLFTTLALGPCKGEITDKTDWTETVHAHGEPLGHPQNHIHLAGNFLNGIILPTTIWWPGGSYQCFGKTLPPIYDARTGPKKPLSEWIALFEAERKKCERPAEAA